MAINTTGDPNKNLIPVFSAPDSDKAVQIVAGAGIAVADIGDANTYRFQVTAVPYTPLQTSLTLVAKVSGIIKTMPLLKGTLIDRFELTFAYNKAIASQTLTNTAGLTPPTLVPVDTGYTYVSQSIGSNMSFTLTANDGAGQTGSIASDVENVTFGNNIWIGKGPSKIGAASSGMQAFLQSLASGNVQTSRGTQYFATGGVNEKSFIAYPKAWGLGTFTKGIFAGGYIRLMVVGATMATSGTESDLVITNAAGFSEAYYVYESLYDNQNDAVTPFVIS